MDIPVALTLSGTETWVLFWTIVAAILLTVLIHMDEGDTK